MSKITRRVFKSRLGAAEFEVGYRHLTRDCCYVLNGNTGELEGIMAVEYIDGDGSTVSPVFAHESSVASDGLRRKDADQSAK